MKTITFCIMGESSSGKDTIVNNLLKINPSIIKNTMYTTRPMRTNECNYIDYVFISEKEFIKKIEDNAFMEHRKYRLITHNGEKVTYYYGHIQCYSPNIMIGTPELYRKISKNPNYIVIPILIKVPEIVRFKRGLMRERSMDNPNYKEFFRRFFQDMKDFSYKNIKKCNIKKSNVFYNINLKNTYRQINKLIHIELERNDYYGKM